MSTRGGIARITKDGFQGVYHHWDSYPIGLGKTLWDLFHKQFEQNTDLMLKKLIDDHPAGWSTINNADFNLTPGQVLDKYDEHFNRIDFRPECFCHDENGVLYPDMKPHFIDHKNASSMGVEYVYAFGPQEMHILSSYCQDGVKMVGFFGCGDPDAQWVRIKEIDLMSSEPDWDEIGDTTCVALRKP